MKPMWRTCGENTQLWIKLGTVRERCYLLLQPCRSVCNTAFMKYIVLFYFFNIFINSYYAVRLYKQCARFGCFLYLALGPTNPINKYTNNSNGSGERGGQMKQREILAVVMVYLEKKWIRDRERRDVIMFFFKYVPSAAFLTMSKDTSNEILTGTAALHSKTSNQVIFDPITEKGSLITQIVVSISFVWKLTHTVVYKLKPLSWFLKRHLSASKCLFLFDVYQQLNGPSFLLDSISKGKTLARVLYLILQKKTQ